METTLLYFGLGLFLLGLIQLTILAFKTSVWMGLVVMFVPLGIVYFMFVYWENVSRQAKTFTLGVVLSLIGADINGHISIPQPIKDAPIAAMDFVSELFQPGSYQDNDVNHSGFVCDGRQHCSQMRSYAEAVFFIRNCPNTKMDGDRDGIPCENDSRFW